MKLKAFEKNGKQIAQLISNEVEIRNTQDALDLMANANYQGASRVIVGQENLAPPFYNLKTGVAGEIVQKFSQYGMFLAIVGEFEGNPSDAFQAFVIESNRGSYLYFAPTIEAAIERVSHI